MTASWLQEIVPCGLTIEVSVNIHETRCHDESTGLENFFGLGHNRRSYLHDPTVLNCYIGNVFRRSSAIHDGATTNNQIEHDFPLQYN